MIKQVPSSPSDDRSCWRQIYSYYIFVLVSANLGEQNPTCYWDETYKSFFFYFLLFLVLKFCLRPCCLLYSWWQMLSCGLKFCQGLGCNISPILWCIKKLRHLLRLLRSSFEIFVIAGDFQKLKVIFSNLPLQWIVWSVRVFDFSYHNPVVQHLWII